MYQCSFVSHASPNRFEVGQATLYMESHLGRQKNKKKPDRKLKKPDRKLKKPTSSHREEFYFHFPPVRLHPTVTGQPWSELRVREAVRPSGRLIARAQHPPWSNQFDCSFTTEVRNHLCEQRRNSPVWPTATPFQIYFAVLEVACTAVIFRQLVAGLICVFFFNRCILSVSFLPVPLAQS